MADTYLQLKTNQNPSFVEYSLKRESFISKTKKYLEGTVEKLRTLKSENFLSLSVFLPCLEEQEKIGSFLSDIDEVILASDQEVKKLQELKKGAMQKIFSQEVRFKRDDGTDYPDWEEKKLGDITSFIRNGFSYKEGNNKNFPVSRIETISDRIVNYNRIGYAEFVPEDYLLKTGDILFSNINSLEHIGKTAFYESNSKLYHGMNLICLRPSDINNKFLFYLLNTETVRSSSTNVRIALK